MSIYDGFGDCAFTKTLNDIDGSGTTLTTVDHVMPLTALRVCHDTRRTAQDEWEKTHAIRVIGHDQKIERPR